MDPVEVQQKLLRFADEFFDAMILGVDKLRRGTNAPDPAEVLQWKIMLGTETCSIASGPNAVADLLDMTVFVTVTRAALEEYWQPKVFGESAQPMLRKLPERRDGHLAARQHGAQTGAAGGIAPGD